MKRHFPKKRRAVLVLSVMACLTLVMLLAVVWLKIIMLERQQVRAQENRLQAEYLATSALSRAAAHLAADDQYDGETIHTSAESLALSSPGTVTIRVEASDDPRERLVSVTAQIPPDGRNRATRSVQKTIHLPAKEQTP